MLFPHRQFRHFLDPSIHVCLLVALNSNKDDLNRDRLANVRMVVLAAPKKKFEQAELISLKEYMQQVTIILIAIVDQIIHSSCHVVLLLAHVWL
jgi:hypothetical protein